MADKESILALENFINSTAFNLMPQTTQHELRSNLASMKAEVENALKDNIIAKIKAAITPLLGSHEFDLSLDITYHNNALSVVEQKSPRPTERVVPVTDSVAEVTKEVEARTQSKSIKSSAQALKVVFPDGTEICDKKAVMTMAHTVEKIGFERVANRHDQKKYSGFNLVGRKKRTEGGVKWQQEIDGWYIFTYMNNLSKAKVLSELSAELNLGLKVYVEGELITRALDGAILNAEEKEDLTNNIVVEETEDVSSIAEETDDKFGVTFADGTYIEGENALDTFIMTLKTIGLSRIPDVGISFGNINLVSVIEKDSSRQTNIDGVYVYTYLTTLQMMEAVRKISDYYYMDLEIEQ